MSDSKIKQSMANLGNALARLEEALAEDSTNSLYIDGTIQRFEFVLELYWKTMKRLLDAEGFTANTPRETLKKAYAAAWLNDEKAWLQMLEDHNKTSHVYDSGQAKLIYQNIKNYFPELKAVYTFLQKKFISGE